LGNPFETPLEHQKHTKIQILSKTAKVTTIPTSNWYYITHVPFIPKNHISLKLSLSE